MLPPQRQTRPTNLFRADRFGLHTHARSPRSLAKKEGQMTFGHESLGNPGTAPSLQDADDEEDAICMPLSDKALSANFGTVLR